MIDVNTNPIRVGDVVIYRSPNTGLMQTYEVESLGASGIFIERLSDGTRCYAKPMDVAVITIRTK